MNSRILIVIVFFLLFDAYAYKGISNLIGNLNSNWKIAINFLYWIISLGILFQVYTIASNFRTYTAENPDSFRFWSGIICVIFFTKLFFIFFHLMDDIVWMFTKIANYFKTDTKVFEGASITRNSFITKVGLGVSALVFGSYAYGVIKGRYSFKIFKEKVKFPNLPSAFNGLKIVQISDLHLGSFINDFDEVGSVVPLINDLKPDLIFFTGDMVNVHSDEAEPWIDTFKKLKAKHGKYSVFGNHDYCDYSNHPQEERKRSINRLKEIHKEMGFNLLEDEHTFLEKDSQKIAIIGMHNWGKGFHEIGSLEKAIKGLDDNYFKLLLSHDPTLWEEKVKGKKNIDLTFSGHTHGMQMGIEIPFLNIKWSPAKLRYKRWAGLYKFEKNYIYINRGLGFLGFPGRVGIAPEITLIELNKE